MVTSAGEGTARNGLASALFKAGRVEESLPAHRRAAELDAGNAKIWIAQAGAGRGGQGRRCQQSPQ